MKIWSDLNKTFIFTYLPNLFLLKLIADIKSFINTNGLPLSGLENLDKNKIKYKIFVALNRITSEKLPLQFLYRININLSIK